MAAVEVRTTSYDRLLELLKRDSRASEQPRCVFLVGAGCSVSGGIPDADTFCQIIRDRYPKNFEEARRKANRSPSYLECMAELPDAYRRQLIGEYVTRCTVNRSHLGIAQLLAHGVVDRVLTTNFDPLIVRACAMVGEFPAVYDCAITRSLAGVAFHPKAVFYLHGQWSGLKLHNVENDLRERAEVIRPVLSDLQKDRTWIIVGYSGRSDPLVEVLADAGEYPGGLFWAAYRSSTPDPHVCDTLLAKPEARVLFGFDADTLFERLAADFNCYPPLFVSSPRKYLRNILGVCREGPYTDPPDKRAPVKFEPSPIVYLCRVDVNDFSACFDSVAKATLRFHRPGNVGKHLWANITGGTNPLNAALFQTAFLSGFISRLYYTFIADPQYGKYLQPFSDNTTLFDFREIYVLKTSFDDRYQQILEELDAMVKEHPHQWLTGKDLLGRLKSKRIPGFLNMDHETFIRDFLHVMQGRGIQRQDKKDHIRLDPESGPKILSLLRSNLVRALLRREALSKDEMEQLTTGLDLKTLYSQKQ